MASNNISGEISGLLWPQFGWLVGWLVQCLLLLFTFLCVCVFSVCPLPILFSFSFSFFLPYVPTFAFRLLFVSFLYFHLFVYLFVSLSTHI